MIIFLILLSTFFSTVRTEAPSPKCPSNMIQSKKDPNICYWFVANATNFDDAENFCVKNGGHLAPVFDQFANFFLVENADAFKNADDFWIGLKSFNAADSATIWLWTWHNSYPIYTDWSPSQGKPSTNSCVASNINTALWSSADCSVLKPFVCQIPAVVDVCDPEWSYFKPLNATGMCYRYMTQPNITFLPAQNLCLNQNANLVSIHGPEENAFVRRLATDGLQVSDENWPMNGVFIGLQYQNLNWKWLDGSNFNYENWGTDRPGAPQSSRAYGIMYPDLRGWLGKWENGYQSSASIYNRFICKKKPNWVFVAEKLM